MAHNLYSKTRQIFDTIEQNYKYTPNNKYNSFHPSNNQTINQKKDFYKYNSKSNISSLNKDYSLKQNNPSLIVIVPGYLIISSSSAKSKSPLFQMTLCP